MLAWGDSMRTSRWSRSDRLPAAWRRKPAGRAASARRRPPRDQWVKTADVIARLQEVLKRRRKGLYIGELREETGYSDMQLHRALNQLIEAGDVVRSGERRHTVYQLAPRQAVKRPARKKKTSRRRSGR